MAIANPDTLNLITLPLLHMCAENIGQFEYLLHNLIMIMHNCNKKVAKNKIASYTVKELTMRLGNW